MSVKYILILIVIYLLIFISGWLSGKLSRKKDGIIRIETNNDGSRDVIRFILYLDLDDIRKKQSIYFQVEDLSKNSQALNREKSQ